MYQVRIMTRTIHMGALKAVAITGAGILLVLSLVSVPGHTSTEFDLSKHSVPLKEILSGGPPKDGIPAILAPVFVPARKATFLRD